MVDLAAALERFALEAFAAMQAADWEEADGGESPIARKCESFATTTRARYPDTTSTQGEWWHGLG